MSTVTVTLNVDAAQRMLEITKKYVLQLNEALTKDGLSTGDRTKLHTELQRIIGVTRVLSAAL